MAIPAKRPVVVTGAAGFLARFPDYARLDSGDRDMRSGRIARTLIRSLRMGRKGIFMQYCRDAAGLERAIHDHLEMTIEFSIDQVLDAYEAAAEV